MHHRRVIFADQQVALCLVPVLLDHAEFRRRPGKPDDPRVRLALQILPHDSGLVLRRVVHDCSGSAKVADQRLQVFQERLLVEFFVRPDKLPAVRRERAVRHYSVVASVVCSYDVDAPRRPVFHAASRVVDEYGLVNDRGDKPPAISGTRYAFLCPAATP